MTRSDLQRAAEVIRRGGIVAYPTESCFGLGCDPRQHRAVRRLLHLKRRSWEQGLILIADHRAQFSWATAWQADQWPDEVLASWPGPVTWLIPSRAGVSPWLRGRHRTIAVRVTAHGPAAALCRHAGRAIVSTSANRHGRPATRNPAQVTREFGDQVDWVLTGALGADSRPSEIRDATSGQEIRAR